MRIAIRHQLSVTPPSGTANAVLQLLLTPQSGPTQTVESWSVEMAGIGNAGRFSDAYGNIAHLVNQSRPEGELVVTVKGVIETTDRHGVLGRVGGEPVPALYRRVTPLTKAPVTLYGKYRNARESRLDVLHGLMARVGEMLGTDEAPAQSQMQADGGQSQSQSGVDKPLPPAGDYAHGFVGGARALDIPARYVTGYLVDAEDGVASFHAWAEAFDDGLGWIGFDPRLQMCPTDRHVRLAAGLDGLSTQPLRLVPAGDGVHEIEVSVTAA
ncbi:transglutaminase domain-containing protein [Devosia sp. ZW T5_3]|uniref:transglutaminase family protein n=1 Tax=Devosia sp. ZW T5_3 TaxID=3378085 RepID=UPI0038523238